MLAIKSITMKHGLDGATGTSELVFLQNGEGNLGRRGKLPDLVEACQIKPKLVFA
jgi:hypothetical protein